MPLRLLSVGFEETRAVPDVANKHGTRHGSGDLPTENPDLSTRKESEAGLAAKSRQECRNCLLPMEVTVHRDRRNRSESRWGKFGGKAAEQPNCRRKAVFNHTLSEAPSWTSATAFGKSLGSSTSLAPPPSLPVAPRRGVKVR